ncbi:RNA-guided endonuclease InsQ/TnpB family protein [Methylobacterium sp. 391_Methyba4]|nr:transposase [Methylobacterium sp. 391_Methyba4]WFS09615.1 transposase [Methylobacterium sp. 391_Methyba4]
MHSSATGAASARPSLRGLLRARARVRALPRRRQRELACRRRGSRRRPKAKGRLGAASAKIAQQRRDHLHKLMRALVSRYRGIAFEVLNLARLKRGKPARSIHDAAWALLVEFVRFKAASAGAELVLVNPRGTSQTCPACSTIRPKTLRERLHRCTCSCVLDQDVAAAEIVRRRAFS